MLSQPKNLLSEETSPYLLQHAENPVHWRPWGQAALEEARLRDRPILLSIGYAACHWCHVMAHESFEDAQTAARMNELYVNIKVDREERPEIDQIYMSALSAMGEQGGWPLTMFLTPEGKPFWGGTYFPKLPSHGRASFMQVLDAIDQGWKTQRDKIDNGALALTEHIKARLSREPAPADDTGVDAAAFASAVLKMVDFELGGLRGAPKFPNAPFMQTLWLDWLEAGNEQSREAVLVSLRKMVCGGIYDQIGGGLARYSTDQNWLIPHFEKMLYDNAAMIRLLNFAYAETGEDLFRIRIEQTIGWLMREMLTPDGFASSLDADSDGEEGLFYCWAPDELQTVLDNQLPEFHRFLSLGTTPQWEGAPVILQTLEQARDAAANPDAFNALAAQLLEHREKTRNRPGLDDKVLTDWNGMAIQALAEAGRALARPEWVAIAAQIFDTILATSDNDNRLPHSVRGQRRLYPALSSDYAAMINAAISLFEATASDRYLEKAVSLLATLDQWHSDDNGLSHFLTARDAADVPLRIRGDSDDATPSATSQIIESVTRLANARDDFDMAERSRKMAALALARVKSQQFGQAGIVNAATLAANPLKLVLTQAGVSSLVSVANRLPDPRRVDICVEDDKADTALGALSSMVSATDRPAAFLCRDQSCLAPIHEAEELRQALQMRRGALSFSRS